MPIQRCQKGGKRGWQYGSQKCYTGANARSRAEAQRRAIKASQSRRKG